MKYTAFLTLILCLCLTNFASARGNESGGGGAVVICPLDSLRRPVQTLDLAENSVSPRKKEFPLILQQAQSSQEILNLVKMNLHKHIPGFATVFVKTSESIFEKINIQTKPVRPGNDLGHFDQRVLDNDCRIDWVAYFDDDQKKLDIDESFWTQLASIDQAALILHEVLYLIARERRLEISSEWIRRSVVDLLQLTEESALKAARFGRDLIPSWSYGSKIEAAPTAENFEGAIQIKMLRLTSSPKGINSCSSRPSVFSKIILCKLYTIRNSQTQKISDYNTCEVAHEIHNRTTVQPSQVVEINKTVRLTAEQIKLIEARLDADAVKETKADETLAPGQIIFKFEIAKNFDLCNLVSYKGISFFPLAELTVPLDSLLRQINNQKNFYLVGDQDLLLLSTGLRRGKDIEMSKYEYIDAFTRSPDVTGEFIVEMIRD